MALVDIDGDPWLQEYEACDKLCCDIAESLTLRENETRTSQKYSSLSSSIYLRLRQLSSEVASLRTRLVSASRKCAITLEEAERRSRLVEKLESRAVQLQQRFDQRPNEADRSQLLQWDGPTNSVRVESENMDQADVEDIRRNLKAMVDEQDQGLETLAQIISRQKEIADTIGNEVELHTEIIDDLADGIDRTTTGLISETRNVRVISRRDSTCGLV